ncbi:MAG: hypothetical protein AAFQ22_13235 [Pseudomonadota bacterium]
MTERTLYVTREGKALVPADRRSEDMLEKCPERKMLMVRTKSPRNGKHHRLLWAVAAKIAENSERFTDAEHVVEQLKFATGHVERRRYWIPAGPHGVEMEVEQLRPASIAYESMDQKAFSAWFEKAVDYICTDILPGLTSEALRLEVSLDLGIDLWPEGRAA